jgi:hypothetical protein
MFYHWLIGLVGSIFEIDFLEIAAVVVVVDVDAVVRRKVRRRVGRRVVAVAVVRN